MAVHPSLNKHRALTVLERACGRSFNVFKTTEVRSLSACHAVAEDCTCLLPLLSAQGVVGTPPPHSPPANFHRLAPERPSWPLWSLPPPPALMGFFPCPPHTPPIPPWQQDRGQRVAAKQAFPEELGGGGGAHSLRRAGRPVPGAETFLGRRVPRRCRGTW